jgi:hypothetical protein
MSDATIDLTVNSEVEGIREMGRLIATCIDDLQASIDTTKEIEYNQKEQEYTMVKGGIQLIARHLCDIDGTLQELVEAIHELKDAI